MTNDPYRNAGAGGSAGSGEPSAPEPVHAQPDPVRPPSDSVWSRPDTEPSPEAAPQAPPPETATQETPSPWPPVADQGTAGQPPSGYPPPPPYQSAYQAPGYQSPAYQSPAYQAPAYQSPAYQSSAYQAPGYPPAYPPPPPPAGQAPPAAGRTNALAVVALVCSLAGIFTGVTAPVGAILGHVARGQIRQSGEEGSQLAAIAIWVGWIITGLIVAAICALIVVAVTLSRTTV